MRPFVDKIKEYIFVVRRPKARALMALLLSRPYMFVKQTESQVVVHYE